MVKSNESGTKKRKITKENEHRTKAMRCIDIGFVYLKWVAVM